MTNDHDFTTQSNTSNPSAAPSVPKPPPSKLSRRGFAAMGEDLRRRIASKGGLSVPTEKRSFSRDRELAVRAGRKGGQASRQRPSVTQ